MTDAVKTEEYYLYVLVRTDMPSMKTGKSVAQGCHAANQFTDEYVIKPLLEGKAPFPPAMEWRTATPDGFGTTIALDVPSKDVMVAVVDAARKLGHAAGVTCDPTYPYIVPRELFGLLDHAVHTERAVPAGRDNMVCFRREDTCAYVFGRKSDLSVLLARFNLLNND